MPSNPKYQRQPLFNPNFKDNSSVYQTTAAVTTNPTPCKYFDNGYALCPYGNRCLYSHEVIYGDPLSNTPSDQQPKQCLPTSPIPEDNPNTSPEERFFVSSIQPPLKKKPRLTNTNLIPHQKTGQKTNPKTDKEYRDILRQPKTTPQNSSGQLQQTRPGLEPSFSRTRVFLPTRNSDPKNNNLLRSSDEYQCAWCKEHDLPHNHITTQCNGLRQASAMDQWRVIYKYRVCDRCLSAGHHWRECQSKTNQCPRCYTFHHSTIECRPKERISKKHNNQAHLNSHRPPNVNGLTLFTRSFSRTCPVVLHYPKSKRSMEGLAIIDDQATRSQGCGAG